mmetsp:Transcript_86185/g.149152  ORF Transcript_86185/g.149152 Transcript_86185/m.149152 type:complete len:210 (-) Transcript_86185:355-984(-)
MLSRACICSSCISTAPQKGGAPKNFEPVTSTCHPSCSHSPILFSLTRPWQASTITIIFSAPTWCCKSRTNFSEGVVAPVFEPTTMCTNGMRPSSIATFTNVSTSLSTSLAGRKPPPLARKRTSFVCIKSVPAPGIALGAPFLLAAPLGSTDEKWHPRQALAVPEPTSPAAVTMFRVPPAGRRLSATNKGRNSASDPDGARATSMCCGNW